MAKQPRRRFHLTAKQFASLFAVAHLSIQPITAFGVGSFAIATSAPFQPSAAASRRYASASSSGEEINGEGNPNGGNLKPRTGWTHNQPGKKSDFWRSGNDASSAGPQAQAEQSSGSSDGDQDEGEEPKTGWLHNAKSKATLAQETKAQQQQQQLQGTTTATSGASDARQLETRDGEEGAESSHPQPPYLPRRGR